MSSTIKNLGKIKSSLFLNKIRSQPKLGDVPALCDQVEALEADNEALQAKIGHIQAWDQGHQGHVPSVNKIAAAHKHITAAGLEPGPWGDRGINHRPYLKEHGEMCYVCALLIEIDEQLKTIKDSKNRILELEYENRKLQKRAKRNES